MDVIVPYEKVACPFCEGVNVGLGDSVKVIRKVLELECSHCQRKFNVILFWYKGGGYFHVFTEKQVRSITSLQSLGLRFDDSILNTLTRVGDVFRGSRRDPEKGLLEYSFIVVEKGETLPNTLAILLPRTEKNVLSYS